MSVRRATTCGAGNRCQARIPRGRAVWVTAVALAILTFAGSAAVAQPRPLRVAVTGDYPPLSARTGDGDYVGFDADVARAFAAERGYALEWTRVTWPELATALAAGHFDVAMTGVTVRADRSVAGRFTVPVAESGAVVLVRDAALANESALAAPGVALTVNAGGHLERVARARFPLAAITALPDNSAVRDAFASGAASAVVTDTLEAPRWRAQVAGAQLVGPLTRDVKAYWLPADRAALASELDAWLLAREADGTLAQLRLQWLGAEAAQLRTALPALALVAVLAERLALQPHVAEAKRASGAPVFVPEREALLLDAAIAATQQAAREARRAAPEKAALAKFFTALFEVSRSIQSALLAQPAPAEPPAFDLESQLRPALTRQTERVAALLPLLPMGLNESALSEQLAARTQGLSGLSEEARAQLTAALAELAAAPRSH